MGQRFIDRFLTKLSDTEKQYLLSRLKKVFISNLPQDVSTCPCCQKTNFIKHGSYKSTQKYKCQNTGKIFSHRTQTAFSGIHKNEKLEQLLSLLSEGHFPNIREIAEKLKISTRTAFTWRTKLITAFYKEVNFNNQILEFDELFVKISRKGRKNMAYGRKRGMKAVGDNMYTVKVFMTYSRTTKRIELFQSHMGKTSAQDVENYLGVKKDPVVYSDSHRSYHSYYLQRGLTHRMFKASDHVLLTDRTVHNQYLNYLGGVLKTFLNDKLRGVSTKYIQGYLNYIMLIENNIKKRDVEANQLVTDNKVALNIFKQKEKEFQYFLRNNGRSNYGTCKDRYYKKKNTI